MCVFTYGVRWRAAPVYLRPAGSRGESFLGNGPYFLVFC